MFVLGLAMWSSQLGCESPGQPGVHLLARTEGPDRRTRVLEERRHHGLELDGSQTFELEVPKDARLSLSASSPEHELRVDWKGERLATVQLGGPLELDLSELSGQTGTLRLSSQPPGAFLGEPVLATPKEDPRRVVMIFVDTLRQDALGVYGSERPTSPNIDAWAERAQVFERAWSPAPWTLPSGRAALSGRQPERWDAARHAGLLFAERGYVSAAVVANSYLTEEFDLGDGWSTHETPPGKTGRGEVEAALRLLEQHEDQDLFLVLHMMDPHLPYKEPASRRIWADEPPVPLEGRAPNHDNLSAAWEAADEATRRELERFARLRYDQNVLAVDFQLGRILEELDEDDVVVLFSDHGEEFWEHGRMGHGFQLSEELTHIPFILQGPGLEPGRRADPATLHDLVPTLLELAELEPEPGLDGVSLAQPQPADRPISLGNTLFWESAIGVVVGDHKWRIHGATEMVHDWVRDPAEDQALELDLEPFHQAYAQADRPLEQVWRVAAEGEVAVHRGDPVHVRFPGGVDQLWVRPGETFGFKTPEVEGEVLVLKRRRAREAFVLAEGQPELLIGEATLSATLRPRPVSEDEQREIGEELRKELEALGYME